MVTQRRTAAHLMVLFLVVIGVSVLMGACRPLEQSSELSGAQVITEKPSRLVILHTNDTWGYYDPCG